MATLTVQTVDIDGIDPSYAAADSGGDEFDNSSGRVALHVKNSSGAACNITFTSQTTTYPAPGIGDLDVPDVIVAVPQPGERIIGPFPKLRFNDANSLVQISYDDATGVTLAAIQLS